MLIERFLRKRAEINIQGRKAGIEWIRSITAIVLKLENGEGLAMGNPVGGQFMLAFLYAIAVFGIIGLILKWWYRKNGKNR